MRMTGNRAPPSPPNKICLLSNFSHFQGLAGRICGSSGKQIYELDINESNQLACGSVGAPQPSKSPEICYPDEAAVL